MVTLKPILAGNIRGVVPMKEHVLPALNLLAVSPVLKSEHREALHHLITMGGRKSEDGNQTLLDLLQWSQYEGSYHRHELADFLSNEVVGSFAVQHRDGAPFDFEADFDGEHGRGETYHVWYRNIEVMWTPVRLVQGHLQDQEKHRDAA